MIISLFLYIKLILIVNLHASQNHLFPEILLLLFCIISYQFVKLREKIVENETDTGKETGCKCVTGKYGRDKTMKSVDWMTFDL